MPCDSIVLNTVELEVAQKNPDLLLKALQEEFGYVDHNLGAPEGTRRWFRFYVDRATVTYDGGELRSSLPERRLKEIVGRIKQGYSRAAAISGAKKFGWTIKAGKDKNTFQVVKR
jgi:hypothetical protein